MRRTALLCFLSMGLLFLSVQAAWAVTTNSPNQPAGQPAYYESIDQFYAQFPTANPPFTIAAAELMAVDGYGNVGGTPPPVGNGNSTIANSFWQMTVETNFGPFTGFGPGSVRVTATNDPQVFDTEMLSLNIGGGSLPAGVMIRESPTRPSLGQTTIVPLGAGQWSIGSFFDVYTDVSFDGGQTWHQSLTSGRVSLVPEPSSLLLCLAGIFATQLRRKRTR